jgi:hypothetical protein
VGKIKPGDKNSAQERLLKHLGLFRKENSNIAIDNKISRWMATRKRVYPPEISSSVG